MRIAIISALLISSSSRAEEDKKPKEGTNLVDLKACSSIRDKAQKSVSISDDERKILIKCTIFEDMKDKGNVPYIADGGRPHFHPLIPYFDPLIPSSPNNPTRDNTSRLDNVIQEKTVL